MEEMATCQAETNVKLDEKLGYLRRHSCGGQHHARVMDEGKHAAYRKSQKLGLTHFVPQIFVRLPPFCPALPLTRYYQSENNTPAFNFSDLVVW